MFFILSKILYYVALPVVWLVVLLLFALFTKRGRYRRLAVRLAAIVVLFFTNPFIINEAFLLWELPPKRLTEIPVSDAGILLTGITSLEKSPHDRVYIERGADRVLHTLWLYKTKKIKKIIISGGTGSIKTIYTTEAAELKKILLLAGVPATDILLEDKSQNTRENALFTSRLLQQRPDIHSLILITSAFHMRRAEGCFKEAGVNAISFPADFYSKDRSFFPNSLIIPSAEAFANWHLLIHELLGFITYTILGYC
ncbi:YdcF family protein [Adhaeribacter radiodurans]|uniref:YdcF family protein n=1 Tax=Adhaeribacter radiodurans TaxID=2745197 RepID=A0A7L7L7Q2_9BACT|nr:YdcF family protein [Adhaeribacter radiodurans]QMU28827.1 YdcF family protein [Adhaeribacter radiodurans]